MRPRSFRTPRASLPFAISQSRAATRMFPTAAPWRRAPWPCGRGGCPGGSARLRATRRGPCRLATTRRGKGPGGGGGGAGGAGGAGAALLVAGVEGGVVTRGVGIVGRLGYTGHSLATDPAPFSWGAGVELGRLHLDY